MSPHSLSFHALAARFPALATLTTPVPADAPRGRPGEGSTFLRTALGLALAAGTVCLYWAQMKP